MKEWEKGWNSCERRIAIQIFMALILAFLFSVVFRMGLLSLLTASALLYALFLSGALVQLETIKSSEAEHARKK